LPSGIVSLENSGNDAVPMRTFRYESLLPVNTEVAYAWHTRDGAFERLTPPWVRVEVTERTGTIENGKVTLRCRLGPFHFVWQAEHYDGVPGKEFRDRMRSGPFSTWEHTHRFIPAGTDLCRMEDVVDYELLRGLPWLDALADAVVVHSELARLFAYRHRVLGHDLWRHRELSAKPLRFLVTGASGLVGSTLCAFLSPGGHTVLRAVRGAPRSPNEVRWDPASGRVELPAGTAIDVLVHLAGENVGEQRWTEARKIAIRNSRVDATAKLAEQIARWRVKPQVFIAASAIGYYGDRGATWVDEESPRGKGFLASLCEEWEAATRPAEQQGVRTVRLRIGVVLSPRGGALQKMWWPFWLGLGGPTGNGRQYMSWIAPDDLAAAILHCAVNDELSGPVNAVAPEPVTNAEFARALARTLRRPAILPIPAAVVRRAFGEMGEELLLASTRVRPQRLLDSGFQFRFGTIHEALAHVLGATT
jgi:uncharacterized protein (TIGR01777 family)